MAYSIEIEVEYDGKKSPKKTIDLSAKLQEIGINPSELEETYTASYNQNNLPDPKDGINQQSSWVSGGQIFNSQPIIYNNQTKIKQTSFNIIARFDGNEKMWNIDISVHIHDNSLNINDKRLVKRHIKGIHKIPDSKNIKINWWINCIQQIPVTSQK